MQRVITRNKILNNQKMPKVTKKVFFKKKKGKK